VSIRRQGAHAGANEDLDVDLDVASGDVASRGPLGLYIHFPFCGVHCPYCDFAVDTRADIPHEAYADAVIAEIAARAPWFGWNDEGSGARPALASIYFGGGTPGLWRAEALGRVVAAASNAFGGLGQAARATNGKTNVGTSATGVPIEITVEANPGELDEAKLIALRKTGVNRLSLGLQSLDDRLLRVIGRNHDAAAGPEALRAARSAGIENVSVDVMFGLPDQTFDDWKRTVDGVLALRPDHVSAYALTIERGTIFGARSRKGELTVPQDEQVAAMQEWARDALAASGFSQYEVSSHARSGKRAVHNSLYWTGAAYLGVGASASSFRPLADGSGWRFSNPRATETYLRAARAEGGSPAPAHIEKRNRSDLENEAVWLALRTTDGLDRVAHAERYGIDPIPARQAEVSRCVERGWLRLDDRVVAPTAAGLMFADDIAARLWL
jgi:oxygen-independent coproporphyrinogen-3 oxidase